MMNINSNINKNQTELLCPAGDFESLQAAVRFGANAVYLAGKEFGMRRSAAKFDGETLKKAVEYAHSNGVKIYVTCNTVPHNDEIDRMPPFISYCREIGVDALIVSDIGTMALCKEHAPGVPVHISVQAGITNYKTASEFYKLGAARVILAREISLEEIRQIRKNTPPELEIEAFVHGSICMSHSGRCILSNYMTGRDANRGDCAQPCRWKYALVEQTRPGEYMPISEEEDGTYILNSRDLNLCSHIGEFIEAGVMSLKIEGRAKSSYYVASVTSAYRAAIDWYYDNKSKDNPEPMPEWIEEELLKLSHRDYSTGFYYGVPTAGQCMDYGGYVRSYDVMAAVEGREGEYLDIIQRNRFFTGDELDVLSPHTKPFTFKVTEIIDADGNSVEAANKAAEKYKIKCEFDIPQGSFLRKKRD